MTEEGVYEKAHLRHGKVIADAKPGTRPKRKESRHFPQLAGTLQESFGDKGIGVLPMVLASVHTIKKG